MTRRLARLRQPLQCLQVGRPVDVVGIGRVVDRVEPQPPAEPLYVGESPADELERRLHAGLAAAHHGDGSVRLGAHRVDALSQLIGDESLLAGEPG